MKIIIEKDINYCTECPYAKISQVLTGDSFEHVVKIFCKQLQEDIYKYLETFDKAIIPKECPLRPKTKNGTCPINYDLDNCSSKEYGLTCETCFHNENKII
jgi:hypothetical protein